MFSEIKIDTGKIIILSILLPILLIGTIGNIIDKINKMKRNRGS
jgi:hypothetical protein